MSIIDYVDNRDVIAWCGSQGIAVTIYDPLAGGILTDTPFDEARQRWIGTPWEDSTVAPGLFAPENADRATLVVDGLRTIADQVGASVAQVALAWLLRQPGVTPVIPGSRKPERARANAHAAEIELTDDTLRTIDEDLIPLGPAFA